MALQEQFESSGNWLFRWRSYPPVLVLVLGVLYLRHFYYTDNSQILDSVWEPVCMAVSFFGMLIRAYAVGYSATGTSGRNTDKQVAKVLNSTGIYSVVRHPLYLGNFFMWLGVSMFMRSWWFSLIVSLIFWVYYERIMFAEEAFLRKKFGEEFVRWAENTPAFIPRLGNWRPNVRPFSLKLVLRREQSGLLGVVMSFALLEVAGDYFVDGRLEMDSAWVVIIAVTVFVFLALTALKKARVI